MIGQTIVMKNLSKLAKIFSQLSQFMVILFTTADNYRKLGLVPNQKETWDDIQTNQLDLGLIEPVLILAHSRTHPYVPYDDVESEVLGFFSKQDIIDNLNLLNIITDLA